MSEVNLVFYLSGVKIPVRAVSVTATAGTHHSFAVSIPDAPEANGLIRRSHGALFFLDPVIKRYRLLCEGEYIGYTRQRTATGQRNRVLSFVSLFSVLTSATYSEVYGLNLGPTAGANAQLSGHSVVSTGTSQDLVNSNVGQFFTLFANPNTRFSSGIASFITAVSGQVVGGAFHAIARKLASKLFALPDNQIASVLKNEDFARYMQQGWSKNNLDVGVRIEDILRRMEDVGFYQHTSLLAPPAYGSETAGVVSAIPELLFHPHLYTAIPPASNVVFKDQITDLGMERSFLQETTRVLIRLPRSVSGTGANIVMANDVERSFDVGAIAAAGPAPTQTNTRASIGTLATHDLMTRDELDGTVISEEIPFPFLDVTGGASQVSDTLADQQRLSTYLQNAARHYYEVRSGAARTATVNCVFLPYVIAGFPCLIEDAGGSFLGVLESVTHNIPAVGRPTTTLTVSHMHEVYTIEGRLRNAISPIWLNRDFLPNNIDTTYKKLFGQNLTDLDPRVVGSAAMVPKNVIADNGGSISGTSVSSMNADDGYLNLDAVAAQVVSGARYGKTGEYLDSSPGRLAEALRGAADPSEAMHRYQFRPGILLSEYFAFHQLPGTPPSNTDPPPLLGDTDNHELYAAPEKLIFKDVSSPGKYGMYDAEGPLLATRRNAALNLAEGLEGIRES